MAKWKLRGDYTFYDKKGNLVRNELGPDNIVKKALIIDDKENPVEGQEHKLELVKPEQPKAPPTDDKRDKPEQPKEEVKIDPATTKQGNTAKVQQPKSVQVQPVQHAPSGVQATTDSKQDPEQPSGDK